MPTARELLQQADALMRRNRGQSTLAMPPAPVAVAPDKRFDADDVPMLTDTVDDIFIDFAASPSEPEEGMRDAKGIADEPQGDPLAWLDEPSIEAPRQTVNETARGSARVVAVGNTKAVGSAPTPIPEHAGVESARQQSIPEGLADRITPGNVPDTLANLGPTPKSDAASDDEQWRSLGEQISMQVLQRIDLFTDTGLKQQLAEHLQPIVERASAELVAAINDRVGQLVRTYVAEAIEREIAQWREHQ